MTRTKRMAAPTEWQLAKKEKKYVCREWEDIEQTDTSVVCI